MQNLIGLYHAKLIKPVNDHRMLNPGNDYRYWVKKIHKWVVSKPKEV